MPAPLPHIARLRDLAPRYDAIISDVWGVLHNGLAATPGAPEALAEARKAGLAVVLLTNAPRPPHSIIEQLDSLGVTRDAYDAIVSSGGVTRDLIVEEGPVSFHHIGPARDHSLFEGLSARPAAIDAAEYVLCTGLDDDESERAEDYRPRLEIALARGMKLYCANPDLVVERGDRLIPCAGAIAEIYEAMGGETIWVGKPHPLVYERARAALALKLGRMPDKGRVLCIGDAFRTDVAGAVRAGYDCLMTLAGIHAHEIRLDGESYDKDAFEALAMRNATRPTATTVSLGW
ncbi:MAG: TIGR01459 family HAD-type hydrolase [Proteobacteria bacterium]|nr:TIGR01459 family HAD-type hydrolase [Pseudomonadota bacterium]